MSEQRVAWKAVLWALGIWLVHCMAALVLTVVLVACVPRHMRLFDIYELDLPAATILTYDLSQYAVNYWYTFVVPLAL
ncbi:MAG TPA: hypothetical protein VHB99_20085, partial [Pirellulales bacterium]|nr:hypothetical protein [Pirellulales bacterium]